MADLKNSLQVNVLDSEEKFTIIARRRHQVINLYMDEINFTRSELDEINYDKHYNTA